MESKNKLKKKWYEYKKNITICNINLVAVYNRVLIQLLPNASHYFGPLIQTFAVVTLIYSSLTTIIQQDSKSLIASSIPCLRLRFTVSFPTLSDFAILT